MSRKSLALLGIIFFLTVCLNSGFVNAEETTSNPDIRVNRVIQIVDGGALMINDTVSLSTDIGNHIESLESFQIGFPWEYHNSLASFYVYDFSGRLETKIGTGVDGTGFLWIDAIFPEPINVSDGTSYNFTLVSVFSGQVKSNQTVFRAGFPTSPSLLMEAAFCNVTVILPGGAILESNSPVLQNITIGSQLVLYSEKSPLEPYANISAWAEFVSQDFLLLEIEEWRREIKIDGLGELAATDFFEITNKAEERIYGLKFVLPPNATDISVQDIYGPYTTNRITLWNTERYVQVDVILREALEKEEKIKLLILYRLPFSKYVSQRGLQDYTLSASLIRQDNWVVKHFSLSVTLPEGAEFQMPTETQYQLRKEGFQTIIKYDKSNITKFDETNINLEYRYLILWASFRPTLWVGTAVAIVGGIFLVNRMFRPAITQAVVTVSLSSKILRKFVDIYEEKRRVISELESLEKRVRRGKISRRKYKLRKSSLNSRLSRFEKDIADLRREIEVAGATYSERMRQLETAEVQIETLNKDISRVEVRYRSREISAEAYRRLLDEYNRIKERAETTIDEILLRFREEAR